MRNNAYWANRMRILEEALLDKSYGYVQNLEAQYERAIREIEAQIKVWYQRFASANGISFAEARKLLTSKELEEFKWTVFDYIKNGQNNAITGAWAKQLENASARVHISRLDALKLQLQHQAEVLHGAQSETLTKALNDLYANGYYRTAFEIQKGLGVGWSLHGLTDAQIKKVLARPWTTDAQTFSDRIWANKEALVNNLNTQLTQMIMRGTAPDKAIKSIANQFNVSKSKAGRLIMTESAAFANLARKDCFDSLGVEKFVIVETLDKETCPLCGQLDGKVFPMSEYQVGVTAPPFHPWCRGTTAPYYDDMDDLITRAAKDDDGKTYEVPENIDYETWKKKYVDNPVEPTVQKPKIANYGATPTGDSRGDDSLAKYTREDGTLTPEREELHKQIIDDTFKDVTPADGQPTFTVMGGGPASGKSTMINSGAATLPNNSVTIDPDAVKAKLPEYQEMVANGDLSAAGFVHEESSALAKRMLGVANDNGFNVVLDGTGDGSVNSIMKKIRDARKAGMAVEGIYATVPTDVAISRALARAEKTGRYVNLDIIRDTHRKVSQILPEIAAEFDIVKLYDTTDGAILIATGGNGQPLTPIPGYEDLFEEFLKKGLN